MEEIKLVKFKGISDDVFQYGCIYEVMKIKDNTDVDIKDIKEILELAKDEIENNNENITATLDLQDLKSLKNLYDLYNDYYFETYIKDAQGNIRYTPYSSKNTFLENWEVI